MSKANDILVAMSEMSDQLTLSSGHTIDKKTLTKLARSNSEDKFIERIVQKAGDLSSTDINRLKGAYKELK